MAASYTLAELQELAREYNHLHTPIALKQPKASLHAQLEHCGVFQNGEEGDEEERVAKLVEAVAREGAVWALGSAGARLASRWIVMAQKLVDAEHELLEDAQPRLDSAQLGPEFYVTGHLCTVVYFCFRTPQVNNFTHFTRFLEQKLWRQSSYLSFFLNFKKNV